MLSLINLFKPTDVSITAVTVQADGLSHNSVSAIE